MKLLLDENIDPQLIRFLTDLGHDVLSIPRNFQASLADPSVLRIAAHGSRTLSTYDRDFGSLVFV